MNPPTDAVVLAVGLDGTDAALTFAVAEARRLGRPLHLVHVLQVPAGEAYVGMYGGMLEGAKTALDTATTKAIELAGTDVAVTAELVDQGWIVDDLVQRTNGASLLVLQHRALSRVKRIFVGSFAQSVAGRATVPVVSVPEGWVPRVGTDNVVTAATQDPVEAPALLRAGFEEARSRGALLVVLHAWWLASGLRRRRRGRHLPRRLVRAQQRGAGPRAGAAAGRVPRRGGDRAGPARPAGRGGPRRC